MRTFLPKSLAQGMARLPSASEGSVPCGSLGGQTPTMAMRPAGLISSAMAAVTLLDGEHRAADFFDYA